MSEQVNKLVPKLRFPEFVKDEAWGQKTLEEMSVPINEKVGNKNLIPVSISAGVGFVPQVEKFGRDISGNQYSLYTHVKKGDFVYNKGNSLKFPQGCVYELRDWDDVAAPNVFICFRFKSEFLNAFYQYCFEKNIHGFQLKKDITSGARSNGLLNISKEVFFKIKLPILNFGEQQKIADCLSSLDDLITAQNQKIEALKQHKKGLMQQLFPAEGETVPKLRFPEFDNNGEWEFFNGDKIFEPISNKKHNSDLPILAISQEHGAIPREMIDYKVIATEQSIESYKVVEVGDFVISLRSFQGGIEYSNYKGICSPAYIILRKKIEVFELFFKYYFKTDLFIRDLNKNIEGIRDGKMVSFSQFSEKLLPLPEYAEQKRIASCLSSIDDAITIQIKKLETIKEHKKGLMQQLFPSLDEV